GFAARWAGQEAHLARRIAAARDRVPHVRLPDARLRQIAAARAAFEVDGLRAGQVPANAASAPPPSHRRDTGTAADVRTAAGRALPHRRRRDPFDAPGLDEDLLDELLRRTEPDDEPPDDSGGGPSGGPDGDGGGAGDRPPGTHRASPPDRPDPTGPPPEPPPPRA